MFSMKYKGYYMPLYREAWHISSKDNARMYGSSYLIQTFGHVSHVKARQNNMSNTKKHWLTKITLF